jgi:hypothetical protein
VGFEAASRTPQHWHHETQGHAPQLLVNQEEELFLQQLYGLLDINDVPMLVFQE